MRIGKLFLASISSGIVTQKKLRLVAINQLNLSRCQQTAATRIWQLFDSGQIQLDTGLELCA